MPTFSFWNQNIGSGYEKAGINIIYAQAPVYQQFIITKL